MEIDFDHQDKVCRTAEVAAIADVGYYDITEDLLNEDKKKTYRVEILSSRKTMD